MKKIYILTSLLVVLFASCKKDGKSPSKSDPDNNGKKYHVSFDVGIEVSSASELSVTPSGKLRNNEAVDLAKAVSFLSYYVYNSSNQLVNEVTQNSTNPNFGLINHEFSNGTYTLIVFATKTAPAFFDATKVKAVGQQLFYAKYTFTIADAGVTRNLDLKRVNGQLQIKVLDKITPDIRVIKFDIHNDRELLLSTGLPNTQSSYTHNYVKGVTNHIDFTFGTYVTNTADPVSVTITTLNQANTPVKIITVDNVIIKPNTRTILSGKLSEPLGTGNFGVGYATYADTTQIEF
ncbi:hypothetical protein LT679_02500 [Mucilaginibacter roseus]|uniref:DUF4397 domain-containing protein n=1 Tax=Mucilaginibacter roseus TaxID=1528868 RepID=A0ABS8U064_9SPHI|nr:hypothetical protein [Mucilaginibacter roseus]MCD8739460.1 hypothetical protein [Mucilaginibacter roseus]